VRAMIVAAGLGTRLLPLTRLLPKPALPVRGVPLVAFQLALLARSGATEVVINTHHLADALERAARAWCPPGVALHFSHERELLGTGGGIRRVAAFLRESDPCLLLGGDMVLDADLRALVAWHRSGAHDATLLLREDPRADRFGTIGVDSEGRVRRIASRFDLGSEARAGVYAWANVVASAAFDALPDRAAFSHLDDWWAPALARGAADVRGYVAAASEVLWEPVGTPAEYLAANLAPLALSYLDVDAASRRAGAEVRLGPDGRPDVVVGAGARLGRGVELRRAVVFAGEVVPDGLRAAGGVFAGGRFVPCEAAAPVAAGASAHPGGPR
jgi:mannose-1-phosphate guanylyltransferase